MTTPAVRIADAGLRQAEADGAQALVLAATCGPDGTDGSIRAVLGGVRDSDVGQACGHAVKMAAQITYCLAAGLPTEAARERFWSYVTVAALAGACSDQKTAAGSALMLDHLLQTIGATADQADVHTYMVARRRDLPKGDSP